METTNTLRWQNRLLFVRTESLEIKELVGTFQREFREALNERKLLILSLNSEGQWVTQNHRVFLNPDISHNICADCLFLMGLDGGIKFRSNINAESLNKLFEIIDAMPMRRAELN